MLETQATWYALTYKENWRRSYPKKILEVPHVHWELTFSSISARLFIILKNIHILQYILQYQNVH